MRVLHRVPHRPLSLQARLTACCACARCAFFAVNWGKKAIGRKTTGTGRCRYLKDLPRKFKNGFREGARRDRIS